MEGFALGLSAAATAFPLVEKEVLPTKFGNVMRSFERYPLILYGLDAIPAWPRLFLILPKPVKDQIRDGRALLDFSANLLVVSVIGALSAIAHIVLAPHRSYDYFALGIAPSATSTVGRR